MNSAIVAAIVFGCLLSAMLLGMGLRRLLPEHYLSGDSKDAVNRAMGLVATMSALLLGLLISSAKGSYDTARGEVIQLAAKVTVLDRTLRLYGSEGDDVRAQFRAVVENATHQLWPRATGASAQVAPDVRAGDSLYSALQRLSPKDDTQRSAKAEAISIAADLGQLRLLLQSHSVASISMPILIVVVCWLAVIFLSFSLLGPSNAMVTFALAISALSVTAAIFLILELDTPFGGLIEIGSEPMLNALRHLGQ